MLDQIPYPFILLFVAFIGLCVGSFLNVVIIRVPLNLRSQWRHQATEFLELDHMQYDDDNDVNLFYPPSQCPHCHNRLKFRHNIPIFSYLFLKGKCAFCRATISFQYPFVELLSTVLSVSVVLYFGVTLPAAFALVLIWFLIVLAFIDLDTTLLPDSLTIPLIWIGLIANYFECFVSLKSAVVGAIIGYLFLWLIYWVFKFATRKEGLGYGDFKLLSALGAWFGWQSVVFITFVSAVLGLVLFIVLTSLPDKKDQTYHQIPFGPALATTGVIYLFYGETMVNEYLKWLL